MKIKIASPLAFHELGQRANQEDALWPLLGQATVADRLFMVCDGMGGHDHGEVASQTVASAIGNFLVNRLPAEEPLSDDFLVSAISEAYDQLDRIDSPDDLRKMGTTLTLVCLHRGGATMAHIGDSRIYHVRPSEGEREATVLYQSRDHSLVMDLYLAGELSREEMDTYEGKNIITRAMQPHQKRRSLPDIVHTTDIVPGDLFLLCSDGVLENISNARLLDILTSDVSCEEKFRQLKEASAIADDNHTACLLHIVGVENEPSDSTALHNEDTSRANFLVAQRAREDDSPMPASQVDSSWVSKIKRRLSTWQKWL